MSTNPESSTVPEAAHQHRILDERYPLEAVLPARGDDPRSAGFFCVWYAVGAGVIFHGWMLTLDWLLDSLVDRARRSAEAAARELRDLACESRFGFRSHEDLGLVAAYEPHNQGTDVDHDFLVAGLKAAFRELCRLAVEEVVRPLTAATFPEFPTSSTLLLTSGGQTDRFTPLS